MNTNHRLSARVGRQRVKTRLCELRKFPRGRGGQASSRQSCPGRPRAFDQGQPSALVPAAGEAAGIGGGCLLGSACEHRAVRWPPGLWRDFKGQGQGAPGSPSLSLSPVLIASKTTF
jgi:hypothetical protein